MAIITLISDWGLKDPYLGAVKGAILSKLPDATIVDISHDIPPFDIEHAAYVIKNIYRQYPSGTIHLLGMNTEESEKNAHTVVFAHEQYFIGADNGIFSLIFEEIPEEIYEIDIIQESDYFTFSTRDRFVSAAVKLAGGIKPAELGSKKNKLVEKILFKPVVSGSIIKGHVTHVDNYENIITNISRDLFKEVGNGRRFSIIVRTNAIEQISESYNDVPAGEILALFATNGMLEIAMNQGNAAGLLGIESKALVRIEFFDQE
ncbi:MAG: SAM-dependent chlorinase/fluorinase [Bacteroidales bacterium]|nr:SAM-dependent chlorinase/fluorinase [Bacteroidales bacterium]